MSYSGYKSSRRGSHGDYQGGGYRGSRGGDGGGWRGSSQGYAGSSRGSGRGGCFSSSSRRKWERNDSSPLFDSRSCYSGGGGDRYSGHSREDSSFRYRGDDSVSYSSRDHSHRGASPDRKRMRTDYSPDSVSYSSRDHSHRGASPDRKRMRTDYSPVSFIHRSHDYGDGMEYSSRNYGTSSKQPCPDMRGSAWVDFTSLATRGSHMDRFSENKPKQNLKATLEVALPSNPTGSASSGHDRQPEMIASGILEVPVQLEIINKEKASEHSDMDAGSPITSALLEGEDELLRSQETPKYTGSLDDAIEQLSRRMKRPNLSTAQRREAIKAKLLERGEAYDPAKFRRGRRKKKRVPEMGETPGTNAGPEAESKAAKHPRGNLATSALVEGPTKKAISVTHRKDDDETQKPGTSSKGVSYRYMSAFKMAIVLEDYPKAKLTAEQGEVIEDVIMDELQPLEDGSTPSFAGTYMEQGALITSCINEVAKRWLETLIPRLKPFGKKKLIVGLRRDILRSTRVFFRAHPKLLKKTPEKVLEMLDKQNPTLKVKEWKVLPAKPDPKGYGFVCFLDEACFNAVRSANSRANLGLWQVSIVSTTVKDNDQGPPDQPRLLSVSSSSERDLIWR